MHPNVNKAERKNKPQDDIAISDTVPSTPSQSIKKSQEKVLSEVKDTVMEKITLQNFPLFEIKKVTIINETEKYWKLMYQNFPIELRLYKSNLDSDKTVKSGNKIEVFGVRKNERDGYVKVFQERKE
ncbi:MAG: hypothetical protein WCL18_07645 [bacterium]